MIKNERNFQIQKEALLSLEKALEEQTKSLSKRGMDADDISMILGPTHTMIENIKYELTRYNHLQNGGAIGDFDFSCIGKKLIERRIRAKLTQRELAEKLGIAETQISRDEKNEYFGVSYRRILEIISAIGDSLKCRFISETTATYELPNKNNENVGYNFRNGLSLYNNSGDSYFNSTNLKNGTTRR